MAAASLSVDVAGWAEEFACAFARIAGRFRRREPRLQARSFLLGVLSDVDTRSCWQLAEQAGDTSPQAMQRLLGEAVWDADAVRDDVRSYVTDTIGHPQAVLILDDTGDLKAGRHSVGVQRQYTGTAGRIENAQVSVFLAYASPAGRALIDRAVYLPVSWNGDPARCAAAGSHDITFATKITLGRRMLRRALDAGVPAGWATADEFYGGDRSLRRDLQTRRLGYVLAVAKSHRVDIGGLHGIARGDHIATTLTTKAWNRYSAGAGAKGRRALRLGLGRRPPTRRRGHRLALAAHPPPHPRRRTRLLPLLQPRPGRITDPGPRRRQPLGRRNLLPERQRCRRTRPTPGPPMGLMAPLHDPGHARRRDPHRDRRHRKPQHTRSRTHPVTGYEVRRPFGTRITHTTRPGSHHHAWP